MSPRGWVPMGRRGLVQVSILTVLLGFGVTTGVVLQSVVDRLSLTDVIGMVLTAAVGLQLALTLNQRERFSAIVGTDPRTVDARISEAMSKVASQFQTTISNIQLRAEDRGLAQAEELGRLKERLDHVERQRRHRE